MDKGKMTTVIKCQNIAPLKNLDKKIQSNSLKIAVFADNGSGKTFISRLFRLTEKKTKLELNADDRTSPTDKLLSFGTSKGSFSFKIIDNEKGKIIEDIAIDFQEKKIPTIPETQYLYHTFNQDYVEENIRALDYEKESHIEGFILGKANIDLANDEKELVQLKEKENELKGQLEKNINAYLETNINSIPYIERLNEYNRLCVENIIKDGASKKKQTVSKTVDQLRNDYKKLNLFPKIYLIFRKFIKVKV